jgi:methyl-accepting chemotaxis protein
MKNNFHVRPGRKKTVLFLCLVLVFLTPALLFSRGNDDEEKRLERHFIRFDFIKDISLRATGTGAYSAPSPHHVPTAEQIRIGQENIRKTLGAMKGKPLSIGETLRVYAAAGEAGFLAVHGSHGDGEISPAISREMGLGRQKFHEEVLIELAKAVEPRTKGLGVNDFGSGADPDKINAIGDIDFTLYAKNNGVEAQWLIEQYDKHFRDLARKKYGVNVSPAQMDIVAHRNDAMIPDWRTRESLADFEIKLRTGTTLLKANPEAYFLEGAYLQQVMSRSVKAGKKTFAWYTPDSSAQNGVKVIRVNASQVPEFFYTPKARKGLGFGGSAGNLHMYHAHADNFDGRAKYILRSLDNGVGLLMTGKRGDYQDIGSDTDVTQGKPDPVGKSERRQIIEDIYDSPQMKYSKDLRDEIFETYEICRKVRIAKDKRLQLSESAVYEGLIDHMKKHSLVEIDNAQALKLAKQTFASTSEFILTANVVRTAKTRARDWLRPHTLKERITYEDDDGNIVSAVAKKPDLEKLQFAAFRELHDAIGMLQQDEKQHVIDQLKEQNPALKRDIEIIENIIRKKREMMVAPETQTPGTAMTFRQKAAESVIDSFEQMGKTASGSSLWVRSLQNAGDAWVTAQALESYMYSNLTQAVIYTGGRKYGPALEKMRLKTEQANKQLMDPIWMTRLSRANSVVHILTLYVQDNGWSERVIKEAVVEAWSHVPLFGMPVDIYRGTVSGLLNYKGDLSGLVKVSVGSGLGQIVLSQFIPGYGPVILVVNTTKGVVNLGGTLVFTPLKDQRVKLAYQGYLDPVDIEPGSSFYKFLLEQTGTQAVQNALAWWTQSTGRKDRIYSPRPSVLHPIDPEMQMSLDERRRAVFEHFQPKIEALFMQRFGGGASIRDQRETYTALESEFLPKIMYKHVHDWWEGSGPFAQYDSLTVKRMMDEYYADDMKAKLTHLLIADYFAGKGELVNQENEWYASLKKLIAVSAGYFDSYSKTYNLQATAIRLAHLDAATLLWAEELEEAERIDPRIEILSSPQVILGKDEAGAPVPVIEKLNLRAKVQASDTEEHPAPFSVRFKVKSGDSAEDLSENRAFSLKYTPDQLPQSVTVTVVAYDANNRPFIEHDVTIPILGEMASSEYAGGRSLEDVYDRLEALAKKAEEMAQETLLNSDRANGGISRASSALTALTSSKDRVSGNLAEAARLGQEVRDRIGSAQRRISDALQSAQDLRHSVLRAWELSREICRGLADIKAQPARRSAILSNIHAGRKTLASLLDQGRNHENNYVSSLRPTEKDIRDIEGKQDAISRIIDPKDRLDEGRILDHLIEADIAAQAAADNAATIKDLIADAKIEYAKGKSFIEAGPRGGGFAKKLSRLDKLMERIERADKSAVSLVSSLEGKVEKINRAVQSLSGDISRINEKIDAILQDRRQALAAAGELAKNFDIQQRGRKAVEKDLSEIEAAALDADVCAESAQNTSAPTAMPPAGTGDRCNEIISALNDAKRQGDSYNYGRLLQHFADCPGYAQAQAIYNDMLSTDRRCNDLTAKLNDAQRKGDLQTYRSILNAYQRCNHYHQAQANYNAMVEAGQNRFCNDLANRLNNAQRRGDLSVYGSLLGEASGCSYYNEARDIYEGMKNQRNMQVLSAFVGGMVQALDQQNTGRAAPPRPPPPSRSVQPAGNTGSATKPPPTTGGGMSRTDCEKKFCPVCATGGSVDLLGVSVNQQCNDCRKKFKAKIEDCMRGGVSTHRPDSDMSQFNTYRVIKCKMPVKDSKGRVVRYKDYYEFAGGKRKYPSGVSCTAVSTGTWDNCYRLAQEYNSRHKTGYRVNP